MSERDCFEIIHSKLAVMNLGEERSFGVDFVKRISKNKFLVDLNEMDHIGAAAWIASKYP
jgi:hypothetical protein